MRTRPGGRGVARALRALVVALVLAVLAACASMPGGGSVQDVPRDESGGGAVDEQQVRVFGVPPQPGWTPKAVVEGFLEAVTSDEADYQTARKYLTPEASAKWDPKAAIKILDRAPLITDQGIGAADSPTTTVNAEGGLVANVDSQSAYTPGDVADFRAEFALRKNNDGQWRIAELPNGLVLSQAEFRRIFTSVNLYWYADAVRAEDVILVPDPIYLRTRDALATTLVRELLDGPTAWLSPVVHTSFPRNTTLLDRTVTIDDGGKVTLQLSDEAKKVSMPVCAEMASQVAYALDQISNVESVELTAHRGPPLCSVTMAQANVFDPTRSRNDQTAGYYLNKGKVTRLNASAESIGLVQGGFGDGSRLFVEIAASRERMLAGIAQGGSEVYVGAVDSQFPPQLRATAAPGYHYTSLSWDGRGGLWAVEERNAAQGRPADSSVVWLDAGKPIPVYLDGLEFDEHVKSIRVSPDGTRAALILTGSGGPRVVVGRVNRDVDDQDNARATIDTLRPVLLDVSEAKSISWNGSSRLLVLASQRQGALQPQYVNVDGSNTVPVPTIAGIASIAASDRSDQPLLADVDSGQVGQIYRLPPGDTWKLVVEGDFPVYPG